MIMGIASGKGGTGKTTVAVSLAAAMGEKVNLLDCDVEEPNAHLFLKTQHKESKIVKVMIPKVDEELCNGCGECSSFCQYNAIITPGPKPVVFAELCHGCGGCALVCPKKAISETQKRIGTIEISEGDDITLIQGKLDIGVAMAPPLIRSVKAHLNSHDVSIIDSPPGTSCPVITAIRGCDFVLLVTEPTPFGLNDLKLAVDMVRNLGVNFGVIVNRHGIGDNRIHDFCKANGISILLEIPDDREIAEAYSRGESVVEALPHYRRAFEGLASSIRGMLLNRGE